MSAKKTYLIIDDDTNLDNIIFNNNNNNNDNVVTNEVSSTVFLDPPSGEDSDEDIISFEEQAELIKQYHKQKYIKLMSQLFDLRAANGQRRNPSMPRLNFKEYMKDPKVLECYIYIEKWKQRGGEDKNFVWYGPIKL